MLDQEGHPVRWVDEDNLDDPSVALTDAGLTVTVQVEPEDTLADALEYMLQSAHGCCMRRRRPRPLHRGDSISRPLCMRSIRCRRRRVVIPPRGVRWGPHSDRRDRIHNRWDWGARVVPEQGASQNRQCRRLDRPHHHSDDGRASSGWRWCLTWNNATIDATTHRIMEGAKIWRQIRGHLYMTGWSTIFVVLIAIPLGIFLTRPRFKHFAGPVLTFASSGQAIPAYGLLLLFYMWLGTGQWPAIGALVLYAILPVLRNTIVGLEQVDQAVIEAGRGMGMSKAQALRRIELPLSVPVILAGVRTALVINVGMAALAVFLGGGGLGETIVSGLKLQRNVALFEGAAMVAMLALESIGSRRSGAVPATQGDLTLTAPRTPTRAPPRSVGLGRVHVPSMIWTPTAAPRAVSALESARNRVNAATAHARCRSATDE